MALIAIASDKGAPGVTTAALALAAVWPRPVLLAECDPAGGDLVYRFPAVGGGHLDPRRGVLSLAVVARRGMQPQQVWEHVQKLHGGLDVLAGVTNAEQGAGLSLLWGPIGKALASLPQADVIADCGRLGADGPLYDLLAEATTVVLVTKVHVADVIRLRDRASAFAAAAQSRGRRNFGVGVVVVADHKKFRASLGEVQHVLGQANAPATVLGGIAHDTRGADLLSGEWGGNLDRTMLIKTAREVARQLAQGLPPIGPQPATAQPATAQPAMAQPLTAQPPMAQPAMAPFAAPQPAAARYPDPQPAYPAPGPAHYGPASHIPASHIPAHPGPQQVPAPAAAPHGPADLAAVTLSAPTVSDEAPRTAFSRVRGRPGRHSALTGQASGEQAANGYAGNGQAVNGEAQSAGAARAGSHTATQAGAQGQPRVARHAQAPSRPGGGVGSFFSRAPMTPLTTSDGQAAAGPPNAESPESPENPDDSGWGVVPWDRQGPAASAGSPGSPGAPGSVASPGSAASPGSPGSADAPGSMGSRRSGGE